MSEREKLNLEINKPIEVTLLYDEPIISTNQYGEYIMYCLKNNGKEFVFFAPAEVHNELKNYGKGDSVIITKLAAQRGTKLITKYAIEKPVTKVTATKNDNEKFIAEEIKLSPALEDKPDTNNDLYYDIMLRSYSDAIAIQEDLGSLIDVTRIAITLFIARSKMPV